MRFHPPLRTQFPACVDVRIEIASRLSHRERAADGREKIPSREKKKTEKQGGGKKVSDVKMIASIPSRHFLLVKEENFQTKKTHNFPKDHYKQH